MRQGLAQAGIPLRRARMGSWSGMQLTEGRTLVKSMCRGLHQECVGVVVDRSGVGPGGPELTWCCTYNTW